jgi:hypothetical protein
MNQEVVPVAVAVVASDGEQRIETFPADIVEAPVDSPAARPVGAVVPVDVIRCHPRELEGVRNAVRHDATTFEVQTISLRAW